LSVWKIFSGFVLRTSHTTSTPSCDATAYFEPSEEKAVENDAARDDEGYMNGETSGGGRASVDIKEKFMRAPPVI
jgi:hypothetical protein